MFLILLLFPFVCLYYFSIFLSVLCYKMYNCPVEGKKELRSKHKVTSRITGQRQVAPSRRWTMEDGRASGVSVRSTLRVNSILLLCGRLNKFTGTVEDSKTGSVFI